jgi:hypothetical protein
MLYFCCKTFTFQNISASLFPFSLPLFMIVLFIVKDGSVRFGFLFHNVVLFLLLLLRNRYSNSLRVGRSGDRILVEERFSAPVHIVLGSTSLLYYVHPVAFLGAKRPGRGVDQPPPSSAEVKEREELYL